MKTWSVFSKKLSENRVENVVESGKNAAEFYCAADPSDHITGRQLREGARP